MKGILMYPHSYNAYPLTDVLHTLGIRRGKERGRDVLYYAPFRTSRIPSLHVDCEDNLWFDFHTGIGGDVVDFACMYLDRCGRQHGRTEALRFLHEINGVPTPNGIFNQVARQKAERLRIARLSRQIQHPGLIRFLVDTCAIPLALAEQYLVEVEVQNRTTGHVFHALGMQNDEGGFAVRNQCFAGTAGRPDVTVIRGRQVPAREVHLFESFIDMLAALADQGIDRFNGDMIVLHTPCGVSQSLPYVESYEPYRRVYSWLDNDRAGEKATGIFKRVATRQSHLDFREMNPLYAGYNGVSHDNHS